MRFAAFAAFFLASVAGATSVAPIVRPLTPELARELGISVAISTHSMICVGSQNVSVAFPPEIRDSKVSSVILSMPTPEGSSFEASLLFGQDYELGAGTEFHGTSFCASSELQTRLELRLLYGVGGQITDIYVVSPLGPTP